MTDLSYAKRREAHGIELWISTSWAHWTYVQFRRSSDGAVIYSGDRAPLTCNRTTFYSAFLAAVTAFDGRIIADYNHSNAISDRLQAMAVRDKLSALYRGHSGENRLAGCAS